MAMIRMIRSRPDRILHPWSIAASERGSIASSQRASFLRVSPSTEGGAPAADSPGRGGRAPTRVSPEDGPARALFAGGCIGVKVPITVAALAGLILGVTFADLAAGCTRQTRLILRIAIATGCCGCATLVVVGATGRGALAQVASVCFLVANSLVLVAMHAAPIQSRQGQALRVIGSACLFSGNAIGLGWHEARPAGMIGGSMAEALHGLGGLSQVVLVGGGLLVAYAAAVVAA